MVNKVFLNSVFFTLLLLSGWMILAQNGSHDHSTRIVNGKEIQAYSGDNVVKVKITEYIFKKLDSAKHLVAFKPVDAKELLDFFVQTKGVLVCEAHALDKTVRVIGVVGENEESEPGFDHRAMLPLLAEKGYVVIGMHARYDMMRFTSDLPENANIYHLPGKFDEEKPFNYKPEGIYEEDCGDCDSVTISREILEKFRNEDYGGEQIDFEFDDVFAPELPMDSLKLDRP